MRWLRSRKRKRILTDYRQVAQHVAELRNSEQVTGSGSVDVDVRTYEPNGRLKSLRERVQAVVETSSQIEKVWDPEGSWKHPFENIFGRVFLDVMIIVIAVHLVVILWFAFDR